VDEAEAGLIEAIQAAPGDDDARLVYADWLEENDDLLKAEYVRLEITLLNVGYEVTPSPEVAAQRARFEEVSHTLDPEWRATMSRVQKQHLRGPRIDITTTETEKVRVAAAAVEPTKPVRKAKPKPPTVAEQAAAAAAAKANLPPTPSALDEWRANRPKYKIPLFSRSVGGDGAGINFLAGLRAWMVTLAIGLVLGVVLIVADKYGCGDRELPRVPNPANPYNPGGR